MLLHNVTAGGDEVLLYASKYGDVRTVVNVSGRYDLNGGLELRLGKNFMEVIKKQGYIDIKDKTGIDILNLCVCQIPKFVYKAREDMDI